MEVTGGFGTPMSDKPSPSTPTIGGMTIAEDVVVEHRRIAETLSDLGPDVPAGVGSWTVADLAAHLLSQTMGWGLVVFLGRFLVARGVRVNDLAGGATEWTIAYYGRRDFDATIRRLHEGVPRLLLRPSVAPVSLFEIWLHHDDVRRANGLGPSPEPESLGEAVNFAVRYQRKALGERAIDRSASNGELLRWLGGRPSTIPTHEPPLRF